MGKLISDLPVEKRWARQKKWATLVLDKGMSLEAVAKKVNRTRAYVAGEIAFGAYILSEGSVSAARLNELCRTRGIGYPGAIKRFLAEREQAAAQPQPQPQPQQQGAA